MINILKTALAAVGEIPKEGIVPKCGPTGPIIEVINGVATTTAPQCGWDEIIYLGENIINTLIGGAFLITALFLIVGAFKMIISQGAPEKISSARSNISSAIIGLIIVLVSWVVLNSFINFFVDKERCGREWWRFQGLQCELTSLDKVINPSTIL